MARSVGAGDQDLLDRHTEYVVFTNSQLEAFAELVRADEREAMVAEATKMGLAMKNEEPFEDLVRDITNDRARGNT